MIAHCLGEGEDKVLAREQAARWEPWLQPISADSPTGEDPGYDDDFQHIREEVNKLSGADAQRVAQLAEKLLTQTCKDLRVATYYLWARLHMDGDTGLADGLSLLAGLVERYSVDVLPLRPNSRTLALEWLTSSRVLDSLSLNPDIAKNEAERALAALARLEQGLCAWPQEQRPGLGALHSALLARCAQSNGEMLQSHTSLSHESSAPMTAPSVADIKSARDLLDSGRSLASFLREQPQGWLAAHRLMKSLRWDTVHQSPTQDVSGNTRLTPPRSDYRVQLKRLHGQRNWTGLLDQVERIYGEGVNHFWLDLQWYLHQALSKQTPPHASWADIIRLDLGVLLERLPGLELLHWNDGTPFTDETTREWISQHVSGGGSQQQSLATAAVPAAQDTEIFSLEGEAIAQADSNGMEAALTWLAARPSVVTGRQRWLLRLVMARVAERSGKSDLAIHLLGELDIVAQRQALTEWEPELNFEVKLRLLKLLRLKTQRHDTDKPALLRRTEALLAALVAMDPARAAVLCG